MPELSIRERLEVLRIAANNEDSTVRKAAIEILTADSPVPPAIRLPTIRQRGYTKTANPWPPTMLMKLDGKIVPHGDNQSEELANALSMLELAKPGSLEKVYGYFNNRWKKRNPIGKTVIVLYDNPRMRNQAIEIPETDWLLGTNYSESIKRRIIQVACRLTGTQFDMELRR